MLAQQSQSSGPPIDDGLKPAAVDDFRRELTACLALCAPAGFDEETRREWLRVAWATLNDVPADLLTRGCKAARAKADHPSKIVPTIMKEIEGSLEIRRQGARLNRPRIIPSDQGARPVVECVTPAQIAEIKAEVGLVTQPYQERPKPMGAPRMPTRADYLAMGVDPSVLDKLPDKRDAA
jgi:hypothetical protein